MERMITRFLDPESLNADNSWLPVFYVWGHSYELDGNDTWGLMEDFCKRISGQKDTWYATNGEIERYVTAVRSLIFTADEKIVTNPSAEPVWLLVDGEAVKVEAGTTKKLGKKSPAVFTLEGFD